jgi:hypothetical protein
VGLSSRIAVWSKALGFVALVSVAVLGSGQMASPAASAAEPPTSYVPAVHSAAYDDDGVIAFGDAGTFGDPASQVVSSPVVAMAATFTGDGYWVVTASGSVYDYGDAVDYGDASKFTLNAPIVAMAATPDGKGYWLVALDGGVFAFGDAGFYGSTGGIRLNQPIVGMAPTGNGKGYWLVASDGGVFAFGDAPFDGSTGGITLVQPVVGMAPTPSGNGYWLVAADGGIFSFGKAGFAGSLGGVPIDGWITGMAADKTGGGYWLANANGDVYHFGDARNLGTNLKTTNTEPIVSIVPTPDSGGYWLLEPDAFPTTFSQPKGGNSKIVAVAASQIQGDPDPGYFCNPYGPCEAWCALFATWVWHTAGVDIPSMSFVGSVSDWTGQHTETLPPTATPSPGDFVYYGTGPDSVYTAVHMGIVAQVWPDGAIDTVEGDAGPGVTGSLNVIINGPYLPAFSNVFNGVPIYGYGVPN